MFENIPQELPKAQFNLTKKLARKILTVSGWHVIGQFPKEKKFILIVAPHTSNWDFIISMLVMLALNIKVTFLGKNSIFVGPLKWLLESLGGVAIDRQHPHGIVGQMVSLFNQSDKMILGLSPEGTRSKTIEWKKGFLYIAQQANVPVIPITLDFAKKEVGILPQQQVSNDIDKSLAEIKSLYRQVCAKNPHLV